MQSGGVYGRINTEKSVIGKDRIGQGGQGICRGKDAPDIFLAAQKLLGTPTEETWVFEDSFVALRTAHDMGMRTVGIYDRNNYDHDRLRALSDIYIGEGHRLTEIGLG